MTAPALYRYVASYQELVDLVAFEIDKAATERFAPRPTSVPEDDPGGRLVAGDGRVPAVGAREPARVLPGLRQPDRGPAACVRREMLTAGDAPGCTSTGLLMRALWEHDHHPIPTLDDLDPAVRRGARRPDLIPAKVEDIPEEHRGLLWVFMQGWAALYGVVTLEVFGHMDPRIIESAAMFKSMVREWIPRLGMADEYDRLDALMVEELSRAVWPAASSRAARRPSAAPARRRAPAGPRRTAR